MSDIDLRKNAPSQPDTDDDARPLTGEPVAPMRLRPEPPRVTRLSRKALAVLGSVAGVGLGGALIYALQVQQGGKPAEEVYATDGRSTPDGLAALPKDYTGPVLGPPLPGDLGRPILDAQNRGQPVPVSGIDSSAGPAAPDPEIERRRQELERRRQELEAARTSQVFFQSGAATATTGGSGPGDGMPNLAGMGTPGQTATPTTQDRQLAFLNQATDRRTVAPDRVTAPPSPFVVQAGAVIPAALVTGIRSDLPGQIVAQVTENVYDSPTGHLLLIPQGTRLIGQYDSGVGFAVGARANWTLRASAKTLEEVNQTLCETTRESLSSYVLEMLEFATEESRHGDDLGRRVAGSALLNALPDRSDRELLGNAIGLGCDAFVTADVRTIVSKRDRLPELPLRILTPTEWWSHVKPWGGLWL